MGKSIDDIWRQMQAQRAAEQQARAAQERALYEQRERVRQEYLQRMRMYEFTSFNPAAAASAAAGAGGGGKIPQPPIQQVQSQQSTLFYDWTSNVFSFFIKNFETGELTDVKTITTFENYPNIYSVQLGGFFITSENTTNSNLDLRFISLAGEVIWEDSTDNTVDVDIEDFARYIAAYYQKDGAWKLVIFDKNSDIKTFNFNNFIEGGGYSYDNVWSGGIVVKEVISNINKYYIINFAESTATLFKEVDTNTDSISVFQYAYSDKIVTRLNNTLWEVWSSTGQKLSDFDILTEFSSLSWSEYNFEFLSDEGSFIVFGEDATNSQWGVILYNSTGFTSKVVSMSTYPFRQAEFGNQKSYRSMNSWLAGGSVFLLFYDSSSQSGFMNYFNNCGLLPVWSSDATVRDLFTFSTERGVMNSNSGVVIRDSDYISLFVDNDAGDANYSFLTFNREGVATTISDSTIPKTWTNYTDTDYLNGRSILQLFRNVTITNSNYGWDDLSDVGDRFYYSFRRANSNNIGNNVVGQEFVMKDTVNDQYWAIKFSNWQNGGGGDFAYTRQLIESGTFSGEVIAFTFSDWLSSESDVIVPGVLELRRGEYGPIYNSAAEGESNGDNPTGTLWNSQYSDESIEEYGHFIVKHTGDASASMVTNSVITGDVYNNNWEADIYRLDDEVYNNNFISNNSFNGDFQLVGEYYDDYDSGSTPTNETGLGSPNVLLNTGLRFALITKDSIGSQVIVPSTGGLFTKLDSSEAFDLGFFVKTDDEASSHFYFYNLDSTLVFQKTVSSIDTWSSNMTGLRMSIKYKVTGGNYNVMIFDGQTVEEIETEFQNLEVDLNDYNY